MLFQIKVPLFVLAATGKDKYRKPCKELWKFFIHSINCGIKPGEAFYVGDAAGRYDYFEKISLRLILFLKKELIMPCE
jgi:histidinol phosphatase-like enzyme